MLDKIQELIEAFKKLDAPSRRYALNLMRAEHLKLATPKPKKTEEGK